MTTVTGSVSPGPKLSVIQLKPVTEPKSSLNSSKESYDLSPLYINREGTVMIATINNATAGRLQANIPAIFHILLSLCFTFLSNGQNSRFPNITKKKGTSVTNAINMTATPIATATADW